MITMTTRMTATELQTVVDWFLHRTPADLRNSLMADLPQLYAKLHPDVDPAVITAAVQRKLNQLAAERAEEHAIRGDAYIARSE